jgi:hypothetical protein
MERSGMRTEGLRIRQAGLLGGLVVEVDGLPCQEDDILQLGASGPDESA